MTKNDIGFRTRAGVTVYLGSVKFFKHLIYAALLLIAALISAGLFFMVRGAFAPDKAAANAIPDRTVSSRASSAAPSHTPVHAGSASKTPAGSSRAASGAGSEPAAVSKLYQALYPDLYCDEPDEAVMREHTVYLTFDDGPTGQTAEILRILRENDVKATFFVVGRDDEASKRLMKQIVDEGHSIGVHSYTHRYREIYGSVEAFLEDFYAMHSLIKEATGVNPDIFRFPGGSINSYNTATYGEIIAEMKRRGFTYYDWNVSAADTAAGATARSIHDNVLKQAADHSRAIVLLHDGGGKSQTVKALDGIIRDLKAKGCAFDRLTNSVKPIIFIK